MNSNSFPDDKKICFCWNVLAGTIKAAIAKGAKTLELIQADTQASTGCGGCEPEVKEILAEQTKA